MIGVIALVPEHLALVSQRTVDTASFNNFFARIS